MKKSMLVLVLLFGIIAGAILPFLAPAMPGKQSSCISRGPVVSTTPAPEFTDGFEGGLGNWTLGPGGYYPVIATNFSHSGNSSAMLRYDHQCFAWKHNYPASVAINNFTAWLMCLGTTAWGGIFILDAGPPEQMKARMFFEDDGHIYGWNDTAHVDFGAYNAGQWYEFTIIDNRDETVDYYINGTLVMDNAQYWLGTVQANAFCVESMGIATDGFYADDVSVNITIHEPVTILYHNSLDGSGVAFSAVNTTIDGIVCYNNTPTVLNLYYRVTVMTFDGRVLHDQVYNYMVTGAGPLQIGLIISARIHVTYWSSLDGLGYEFSLAKLYINGTRVSSQDPEVQSSSIAVVVQSGFNQTLYNQTIDVSTLGAYLDIFMNITSVCLTNNFSTGVIFHYSLNGIEISFPMNGQEKLSDLRWPLGGYRYWVTDPDTGDIMRDENGTRIDHLKTVSGPAILIWGYTEVTFTGYIPSWWDYVFWILGIVLGIIAPVAIAVRAGNRRFAGEEREEVRFKRRRKRPAKEQDEDIVRS